MTDSPARPAATRVAAFAACLAFACAVLGYVHNRHWNAFDDGAYLHIADRMLDGEVLHRDVQDVHAGYINFANAAALWLFGNDAVSPRYPLVAMGLVNAALAFWLLAPRGIMAAVAASVAATCLSSTQFMNPTAHWYALFLTMLVVAVMTWPPRTPVARYLFLGLLVGVIFLFRQLTGVFVGAAVLLYLLLELPQDGRGKDTWAGRGFIALMALVLAAYFVRKLDAVAVVMYCVWPVALLLWGAWRCAAPAAHVARVVSLFSVGFFAAWLPLVAYHLFHGSLRIWLDDAFFSAMSLTNLGFFDQYRYWWTMVGGAKAVVHPAGAARALTGLFWLVALALPVIVGGLSLRTAGRDATASRPLGLDPVSLMAVFYFPVALHLQKYMYFFFAAPLLMMGVIAVVPSAVGAARERAARRVVAAGVLALSLIGLVCLSGGTLAPGSRVRQVKDHGIPRCSLWLEQETAQFYRDTLALIDRETRPGDAILALPVHPELYYLSGRRNPTRFYNTALALHSEGDVRALLGLLERSPPKLVFDNPRNHYHTAESGEVMRWVRLHYEPAGTIGAFDVYRYRRTPAAAQSPATRPAGATRD